MCVWPALTVFRGPRVWVLLASPACCPWSCSPLREYMLTLPTCLNRNLRYLHHLAPAPTMAAAVCSMCYIRPCLLRSYYRCVRGIPTSHAKKHSKASIAPPPSHCTALHTDISHFAKQLLETEGDANRISATVARTSMVLQTVWPGARIHTFGSVATSLRLPYGDIDLMIEAPGAAPRKLLPELSSALRNAGIPSTILVLLHANVPILKWTDRLTGMKVDACLNNFGGCETSAILQRSVESLDKLRPLTLVLKSQNVGRSNLSPASHVSSYCDYVCSSVCSSLSGFLCMACRIHIQVVLAATCWLTWFDTCS